MMPADAYPFADRFAWVADRFGIQWQVIFVGTASDNVHAIDSADGTELWKLHTDGSVSWPRLPNANGPKCA